MRTQARSAGPEGADVEVVGVDGWSGGWVAAILSPDGLRWATYPTFAQILDEHPRAHIGVDMPIGLPEEGRRACDQAARDFLGPARSSIFYAPTRAQVQRWREDSVHPTGIGVSRQTWNLIPRIAELDDLMSSALAERVHEVHPECSFRTLDPTITESKKSARGMQQRLDALNGWVTLPSLLDAPQRVPVDDVLDATVVAWTTRRHRDGRAVALGNDEHDARGLIMRVVR